MASIRKQYNKRLRVCPGHSWYMPPKQKMFVSAYTVTRHYGGPEEGGWWYDWYEHVATYPRRVKGVRLISVQDKMKKKYAHLKTSEKNRYSVRGGADVVIVNENWAGESRSITTPHYE